MESPTDRAYVHPYRGRPLSPRQRQVLRLLDEDLDAEQIAEAMGITEGTLRQHTRRLLRKFPGRVNELPENARAAGVTFEE